MPNQPLLAATTRQVLHDRFPKCFAGKGKDKRPLAIGIHKQVFEAAPDLSHRSIRLAIRDYVTGYKYIRNMRTGATRVNLDGSPAGVVSAEHGDFAHKIARRMLRAKRVKKQAQQMMKVAA